MATKPQLATQAGPPPIYQIRINGHLGGQWQDWFGGLVITQEDNGETVMTGPVVDQAALHGLLRKVRNLGLPLVAVNRIEARQSDDPAGKP